MQITRAKKDFVKPQRGQQGQTLFSTQCETEFLSLRSERLWEAIGVWTMTGYSRLSERASVPPGLPNP